jgi:tRNA G18 (ribose-2'-O)-methylase SpoU
MTEGSDPSPILGDIDRLAREAHVPVRLVSPRRLESVQGTDAPQGVVAFAEPLTAASLDELVLGWDEQSASGASDLDSEGAGEVDDEVEDDDEGFFIEFESDDEEDDEFPVLIEFLDDTDETEDDIESDVVSDIADDDGADEAQAEAEEIEAEAAEAEEVRADAVEAAVEADAAPVDDVSEADDAAALPATTSASKKASKVSAAASNGRQDNAFLVLLEGVTDPQNLGAILRSAECSGVTGVAVPRHRSVHVTPAVTKAAAGAIEYLQMALVAGMPSALQELEGLGVMTVGLDERGTKSLYDLDLGDRPVALVLGSEGSGLSPLSRRRCEVLCRIPVDGEIPSLNVSAAAAVACFEVARQRGARKRR